MDLRSLLLVTFALCMTFREVVGRVCSPDHYHDAALDLCRPCSGICDKAGGRYEKSCEFYTECSAYHKTSEEVSGKETHKGTYHTESGKTEKGEDKKAAHYKLDKGEHSQKYTHTAESRGKSAYSDTVHGYLHSTSFWVMLTLLVLLTVISVSSVIGVLYYRRKSRSLPPPETPQEVEMTRLRIPEQESLVSRFNDVQQPPESQGSNWSIGQPNTFNSVEHSV